MPTAGANGGSHAFRIACSIQATGYANATVPVGCDGEAFEPENISGGRMVFPTTRMFKSDYRLAT